MGKKHHSDDAPKGRGRFSSSSRPTSRDAGSKFIQPGQERANRDQARGGAGRDDSRRGGDRPAFGGRPAEGGYGGPRKFGNGGGSFGGPRKFGNSGGGSFGGRDERPARDNRFGGGRDERPARDSRFGGDARNAGRGDDRRDQRDERPVRNFEAKQTWKGQPYRREDGEQSVPRGQPGERNRKFIKGNPNAVDEPRQEAPRPRPQEDHLGSREYGPDRPVRPARSFDPDRRPESLAPQHPDFSDDATFRATRRAEEAGSREPRESDDRKPSGFGGGASGERRSSFGRDERRNERPDRDRRDDRRSERPAGTDRPARRNDADAPRGAFGRDERRAPREERPRRAYDERPGRPDAPASAADSNQAGKRKRGEVTGEAPDYKNLRHYDEDKNRGNKRRREEEEDSAEGTTRLNRYIANAGVCSRRDADALIAAGEIKVNGEVVTEMGYQVQPSDTVQYGKTNLSREKQVYLLLNKPKDFLTTTDDPEGRRTVMELIKSASKERVFPVGRLDRNTTGLLLFTNDGEVAQKLSHPSHRNKKIYQVELDKPLTEEDLRQIAAGVELEDGKAEVDDVAVVAGNPHFVGVEIHIGRNRIVRRIFEHLGYDVVALDRVQYAGLTKKDLPRGKWRFLNEKEVIRLKYFM
ncbi:pseudouridine synthase [Hymenobacter lapidiphilus]|uniref:pseudouridine synthase n=1 Tax=Hymenobacter lapidiphilus TaxID=2608003 RepID=UPI001C409D25|nr:pseudouridine synthase [Hymenobacter lapidiphilus]